MPGVTFRQRQKACEKNNPSRLLTGFSTRILKYVDDLIRGLNADIGRKDFFEMTSIKDAPMKEDKDNKENQEAQSTGLSQKRDAVYKPLDMAMAKKALARQYP